MLLKIKNLSQTISQKTILNKVSITITKKQITALLGPNGAGKTTLIKTIMGIIKNPKPTKSEDLILWGNEIINNWPIHKRVDAGIIYLPQHTSLFEDMTAEENLQIIYQYHPMWQKKNKREFLDKISLWLETTNLQNILKQKTYTLSGGQKRKLEVIRAILMLPKIMILDEPFAGVDPKSIYELKKIFKNLVNKNNISIFISDHNVDQLLSISEYLYVLLNGKIITKGTLANVAQNQWTKELYFGEQFHSEILERFLNTTTEKTS